MPQETRAGLRWADFASGVGPNWAQSDTAINSADGRRSLTKMTAPQPSCLRAHHDPDQPPTLLILRFALPKIREPANNLQVAFGILPGAVDPVQRGTHLRIAALSIKVQGQIRPSAMHARGQATLPRSWQGNRRHRRHSIAARLLRSTESPWPWDASRPIKAGCPFGCLRFRVRMACGTQLPIRPARPVQPLFQRLDHPVGTLSTIFARLHCGPKCPRPIPQ